MYTIAEELLRDIKILLTKNYPNVDLAIVDRTYEFAKRAHDGQFRLSGRPHIDHVMATGQLLASWRMPLDIVLAGILHDVPEDTKYTLEDIEKEFGKNVWSIVQGETKLSTLHYSGRERYAENLRKMFFAIAQDVRVVIVKCADRIDNLKTLNFFPENKQKRIALESMEIYAPIADRLGMGSIKGDLEDLSFKYVNPKEYEWVTTTQAEPRKQMEEHLEKVRIIVKKLLTDHNIKTISIHGRAKHLYSLYQKLLRKDRDITKIYDLVALRIIVPTIQDCYSVLGILHSHWRPLKGRIKDYIAQPKPNGYQSLHTTVFCDDGRIIEFQVRTQEMHDEAEFGIAAHWFYNEKGKQSKKMDKHNHATWLKDLTQIHTGVTDQEQFLKLVDSLKLEFFKNHIFVFTPNGDVIDLPEGATPIDFAYAIHTDLGNQCTGARVNDEFAPLPKPLLSGDIVEIIKDKNKKGPSADWLKIVKTTHARAKIKDNLKKLRLFEWFGDIAKKATLRSSGK